MSTPITISSLKFVKPWELSRQLLDPQMSSKIAVVDVRDNDYIGGHIKGSLHAPVDQFDVRLPELLRTLADKEKVVFHCMLSQQRGPKTALQYARARVAADAKKRNQQGKSTEPNPGETNCEHADKSTGVAGQEVCVLEGGFGSWQQTFGSDENLTEGYVKELWDAELI